MGKGRKRLPTKVKAMQGTLEKSRITENEMEVAQVKSMPSAPVILEGFSIDVWQKTTNELYELGMLHNVDLELLSAYCYEMGVYFEMAEILKKGKTEDIYNQKGELIGRKARPEVKIQRDALAFALKIAANFGFTPSARATISMPEKSDDIFLDL
jgi:P27 family predicted phage terminase small subunit